MTDYKNLKLIASSSPHIRSNEDTRSIMLDFFMSLRYAHSQNTQDTTDTAVSSRAFQPKA